MTPSLRKGRLELFREIIRFGNRGLPSEAWQRYFPRDSLNTFLLERVGGSCFVNVRQCNPKSFKNQDQENLGMTEPNPSTPIITIISNASLIIATIIIIVGFFS